MSPSALANTLRVPHLLSGLVQQKPLSVLDGKTVLLYFTASWCPPCRGFTPTLIDFYNKHHTSKNFEVVAVTWDEDEGAHSEYVGKMPWLSTPFDLDESQRISEVFKVASIPTLIALDPATGEVFARNARANVVEDPEASNFPWKL